jgi:hypothetical protein
MGQWVRIEHEGGGLFQGHINIASWLADYMNTNYPGNSNNPVVLYIDESKSILEAIVFVGNEKIEVAQSSV